ncbi:MAG: hypothetical protein M1839_001672 [Geoglossum umbratile]|nr:MAG: hypothetical protein M1839_001672 [Geoglossum umbratile]
MGYQRQQEDFMAYVRGLETKIQNDEVANRQKIFTLENELRQTTEALARSEKKYEDRVWHEGWTERGWAERQKSDLRRAAERRDEEAEKARRGGGERAGEGGRREPEREGLGGIRRRSQHSDLEMGSIH